LLAPRITLLTRGLWFAQAIASCDAAAEISGDALELRDRAVLGLIRQVRAQETERRVRAAAVFGNARLVLAREQAGSQRTPRGEAQAEILVQARVFLLHALAVKQVVLRLLHDRLV